MNSQTCGVVVSNRNGSAGAELDDMTPGSRNKRNIHRVQP